MSFKFGKASLKRLSECHPDLQRICFELIKEMDVTILCGHRGKRAQNEAYRKGNSKLRFPHSKHNKLPSLAVDVAPFANGGVDWNDIAAFEKMCSRIEEIAKRLDIKIRLGRDFKGLVDLPHIEIAD